MGSNTPCHFCLELPIASSSRTGRTSRCPLCKSTILEDAGGSFRIDENRAAAKPASKRGFVISATVGLLLACAVAIWHFQSSTPPDAPNRSATPVAANVPLMAEAKPRAESWPVAVVKESSLRDADVVSQAKPQTYPVPPPPPEPPPVFRPTAEVKDAETLPVIVAKAGIDQRERDRVALEKSLAVQARWREQLLKVPEVTLVEATDASTDLKKLHSKASEIFKKDVRHEAFINWVKENRTEVTGLPYILGDACQLPKTKAQQLQEFSIMTRRVLQETSRSQTPSESQSEKHRKHDLHSTAFWHMTNSLFADVRVYDKEAYYRANRIRGYAMALRIEALPALSQILGASDVDFRMGLVAFTASIPFGDYSKTTAPALARHAVFDLDSGVRAAALQALRHMPPEDFMKVLLDGFNHPWLPAVQHASHAVVDLHRSGRISDYMLLPKLKKLLEGPDPCEPFTVKKDGKPMVRELVRINHHRNCILCHATGASASSRLMVQVPSPDEPLPPSFSFEYYNRGRGLAIQPDITYLRQDFSVMQPVKDHGKWPEMQRFDFLVRTREASADEIKSWEARKKANEISEHRQAILWAIREITNEK